MKIAFTSCMNHEQFPSQAVWPRVAAQEPDYLFLLGDQIYMDFWPHLREPAAWDEARFEAEMRAHYQAQWAEPGFDALLTRLRARQAAGTGGVHGTWDDHDFAWDNAVGSEVPLSRKRIAQRLFQEFVGAPPRGDGVGGIHHAVPLRDAVHGVVGKAIFLDTRWHREPPGEDARLLGDEQLDFLERELRTPVPLTVICAGTPQRAAAKGWAGYPREWARFRELVGERHVLFLAGDIHENAFLPPARGTRTYEIVASGAAVKKYKLVGRRENHGLIEWSPQRTLVTLTDKRGTLRYAIDNASFDYEELEAD